MTTDRQLTVCFEMCPISSASGIVCVIGFSQYTSLPAFIAAIAINKYHAEGRQLHTFMAHSLDKFCDAAQFRSDFMVKRDEPAGAEPHQFAERAGSPDG